MDPQKVIKSILEEGKSGFVELVNSITSILHCEGYVYLYIKNKFKPVNFSADELEGNDIFDKAIKKKQTVITSTVHNIGGKEISNSISIPLIVQNSIIGILLLTNFQDLNIDIQSIDYQLSILKLSLYNMYLQEILHQDNKTDDILKTKDIFLANMSHEIRTPLNGVIGYAHLLLQTETSEIQKRYLHSMNQCCKSLLQIINDILDYSKLASSKMKIKPICMNINELISNVERTLKQEITKKNHNFNVKISKNVPEFVICDNQKLLQILINLVSNAIKYTENNGDIRLIVDRDSSKTLLFTIIDNGIGISKEDQYRLFRPFSQIDNGLLLNKNEGVGLGLSIAKMLVELLGGNISVESKVNTGSTFKFTVEFQDTQEIERKLDVPAAKFEHTVALIVDDNSDNRLILTEFLISWGIMVIPCSSAGEAIKLVNSSIYKINAVFLDFCMPGGNGVDLAKQIRENHPDMPIIGMSSIDTSTINTSDFDEVLIKPINKLNLYEIVSANLNQKSPEKPPTRVVGGLMRKTLKNHKILIAEDIEYSQEILKSILNTLGYYNIDIADNGIQVIQKIREKQYDILLLDLKMPKMDGYKVLEYLKVNGFLAIITVIPVSASVLEEDKNKCKSYGLKYFITKPMDIKDLKKIMASVTSGN